MSKKIAVPDPIPGNPSYYTSVLEALDDNRIFGITKAEDDDSFEITEKCDDYFSLTLTKDQVRTLAQELLAFIEEKTFCANCRKPADHLTRYEGSDNYGWRDMRGMELCDSCLRNATTPRPQVA